MFYNNYNEDNDNINEFQYSYCNCKKIIKKHIIILTIFLIILTSCIIYIIYKTGIINVGILGIILVIISLILGYNSYYYSYY